MRTFLTRARRARADVLVHFTARRGCYQTGNRYSKAKVCRAPSVKAYTASFNRFRRAYPFVRTYGVWNEANHISQPIYKNPKRAAQYFLAARKACRRCTLVAADVLDIRGMQPYLQRVPALRAGQGEDLRPAQLPGRQPRPAGRDALDPAHGAGRGVDDGDGRHPLLPAELPALAVAPEGAHAQHVQAGGPLRHAA